MTRLHIGHTKLTHFYLLQGEEQSWCIPCQTPLTVKHILMEYINYSHIRKKYYKTNNLKKLFQKVNTNDAFFYLRKIGMYNKLFKKITFFMKHIVR